MWPALLLLPLVHAASDDRFVLANPMEPSYPHSNHYDIHPTQVVTDSTMCYSCMSSTYEANWRYLRDTYKRPMNFTDQCNLPQDDPVAQRGIGLVRCNSICIKMFEHIHIGGYSVPGYIRGCFDDMLRHGFNRTMVKWYRWLQRDSCNNYSRKALLQLPPSMPEGDLTVCTCYSDGCNGTPRMAGGSGASNTLTYLIPLALAALVVHAR